MQPIVGAQTTAAAMRLARAAASGDERALRQILDPLSRRLSPVAWHMTYDHHESQDLCQEALAKVARPDVLLSYRGEGALEGFLMRSAVRTMISARRTRRVADVRATVVTDVLPEFGGADARQTAGLDADLRDAMLTLPERARLIVLLIAVGGYTHEEVAETVRLPVGTVKSSYSRARASLRLALDRHSLEGAPA